MKRHLPGPRGVELYSLGLGFQKHPLETFERIHRDWGDVVYCPWPNRHCVFLFDPEHLKHVLRDNQTNYHKSAEYSHMKPLLGEGLLTSEGEMWRNQRRLMAGEFHPSSIEAYLDPMKQRAAEAIGLIPENSDFDVSAHFSALTFSMAGDMFFGADVSKFSNEAKEALEFEMERINKRIRNAWNIPSYLPTPENLKSKKAVKALDEIVENIMESDDVQNKDNILSKLLEKRPALSKKIIRDEVMTLLLAGHETTSNTLTWTLMYLCQHQEWQDKLLAELASTGKKVNQLSLSEINQLKTFKCVLQESLRLKPSIPVISRMTLEADEIGGHKINPGISVQAIPYVTHRDPRFWTDAEVFLPDRFLNRPDRRDDFTYFPFARGGRSCIGEGLAMIEATLILASFVEEFSWSIAEGFVAKPTHALTLKSSNGLRVVACKRH